MKTNEGTILILFSFLFFYERTNSRRVSLHEKNLKVLRTFLHNTEENYCFKPDISLKTLLRPTRRRHINKELL